MYKKTSGGSSEIVNGLNKGEDGLDELDENAFTEVDENSM